MMTTCDYCDKPMFMNIFKCRACKYKCHRECIPKVPHSCGLSPKIIEAFRRSFELKDAMSVFPILRRLGMTSLNNVHLVQLVSPLNHVERRRSYTQSSTNIEFFYGDPSSNTLRTHYSTPSSPALMSTPFNYNPETFLQQFDLIDVPTLPTKKEKTFEKVYEKKFKSELAISNDKEKKNDININDVNKYEDISSWLDNISELERAHSQESLSFDGEIDEITYCWPRFKEDIMSQEWDIVFDELKIKSLIGKGRFSRVYRGFWHGDIAVKFYDMSFSEDEALRTFRLEFALFRTSQHDNLIGYLGTCVKSPQLGVVTNVCRGISLYTRLHIRKDRFTLAEINTIAQQICHGMKYLHSCDLIHKDLRSKNVFVEKEKIVITDYGLFNITKMCPGNSKGEPLNIPPGWLCYLAPEIIRQLKPLNLDQDEIPYSFNSDVYAFGTIWYELLCNEWPFRGQPPEAVIWQVGKGMKQSLSYLHASREVKDILMYCWSYHAKNRFDFEEIISLLERLPRKKLACSSSNPTSTLSAESMF